ncbi:MAG: hypothetical protein ACI9M9_000872 [Flavobacteriaceae bacterium]|jgi:hypothetical protein
MKKIPCLLLVLFACTSMATFAQSKSDEKAEVHEKIDVVNVYEQMALDGDGTPYIYKELAYAYYFKNEYKEAKKWFEELFEAEEQSDETVKHRYRQTLKVLSLDFKENRYLVKSGAN